MVVGLSLAAVTAGSGCNSRHESAEVVALGTASGALSGQCGGERAREVRCCEQHFPRDHRLRATCLSESARHRGICGSPPPDAGSVDAATPIDAAPADAGAASDGAASDASAIDAAPGVDASDAGNPVVCPTTIPISAISETLGNFPGFRLSADVGSGETVTWSASGTGFTLLGTSGESVDLECQAFGTPFVTATITGPGSCSLAETFPVSCPPVCGNGILERGEQCDPPEGDACNSQCQLGPNPTCGDGVLEPNETCDLVSSQFCQNCQTTACYSCVLGHLGSNDICRSTEGAQKIGCQTLEQCMFSEVTGFCNTNRGFTFNCFCADATCSTGPSGPCGTALQAYLGTTDHDALVAAANSAEMTQLIAGMGSTLPCHSTSCLNR
jgi:hypothetical protein